MGKRKIKKKVEKIKRVEKINRMEMPQIEGIEEIEEVIKIPKEIEEVNSEWISSAFRYNHIIRSTERIFVINVTKLEKKEEREEGMLSYRLELGYDLDPPDRMKPPRFVIIAFPKRDDESKNRHDLGLYATSHLVYVEVVPRLDMNVRNQIHHCYFTGANAQLKNYVWIMEDNSYEREHGYVASLYEGMKEQEAIEALRFLAGFHSHWWNNEPALNSYDSLLFNNKFFYSLIHQEYEEKLPYFKEFCDRTFQINLLPEFIELTEFVKELFWPLMDFAEKYLPRSLIHGDFSAENCFFHPQFNGNLSLSVSSWQQCTVFFVGYDLALFMSRCLSLSTRKKNQSEFLQYYLEEILQTTDPSKTNNLDLGLVDASYKIGLAIYLVRMVVSVMGNKFENDEDLQVEKKLFSRLQATILSNNVLDFLNTLDLDVDVQPPSFN